MLLLWGMGTMSDLSPTMQQAAAYARQHGGSLERFPGGYWCEPGRSQWDAYRVTSTFSTKTIEALVARGVAEYTQWKDGRNGRFPIKVTLVATPTGTGDGNKPGAAPMGGEDKT